MSATRNFQFPSADFQFSIDFRQKTNREKKKKKKEETKSNILQKIRSIVLSCI